MLKLEEGVIVQFLLDNFDSFPISGKIKCSRNNMNNAYIVECSDGNYFVPEGSIKKVRIWDSNPSVIRKNRSHKWREYDKLVKYCAAKGYKVIDKDFVIVEPNWKLVMSIVEEDERIMRMTSVNIESDIYGDATMSCEFELSKEDRIKFDELSKKRIGNKFAGYGDIRDVYREMIPILLSKENSKMPQPKKVIFNGPATIVLWQDGTKTVVKRFEDDESDRRIAIVWCIMKKIFGSYTNADKYIKQFARLAFYGEEKEENKDEKKEN